MNKRIEDLEDGFRGTITVLLLQVNKGVTAKGAPYLSLQFQDKTGRMDAKYWNVNEALLHAFAPGMIVNVQGDVLCHQKQLQFRVNKMEVVDKNEIDINEFVKSGSISKEELKQRLYERISEIKNQTIYKIVLEVVNDYEKDFFDYPAATKNHHDFSGGLATHVVGMLDLADHLCKQYPLLNKDVLFGGVILHDLGKLIELSGALVSEYTVQGKLLGHISIMQAIVYEKAKELHLEKKEETMLLRHMILSHHGQYEYGSPVLPMLPEAEMLYLIDNIDARMNTIEKALSGVQEGEFTPRIFALENRSFYKQKIK